MPELRLTRRKLLLGLGGAAVTAVSLLIPPAVREAFPTPPLSGRLAQLADDEPFDVCIVGSGPAGSVLGLDLVGHRLRTVILESGPNLGAEKADDRLAGLAIYRNSGAINYPLNATRIRAAGGTSLVWTGRCTRLYPLDFGPNAYTPPGAAWPLSYDELEPYYERAETTLRVRGGRLSEYHPPRKRPLPLPSDIDISALQSLLAAVGVVVDDSPIATSKAWRWRARDTLRVATDLLPDFSASPYARLITGATVSRLAVDADGRVVGAEARSLDGAARTIRASVYVVACGAVESARLLLLSRSARFPNGIGNTRDLVGRYFMEHPNLNFRARLPREFAAGRYEIGRSHQFYEQLKREGLGSVIVAFKRYEERPEELAIDATLEMKPVADNRIALAGEQRDAFGEQAVDLSLSLTADDMRTMERARSLVYGIFADLGATEVQDEGLSWSHHHLGGCRMGEDPRLSVADRNLRVHETPNLYVLSSAVFVTGGAAHPTLTITALAHRLAEHLATVLGPRRSTSPLESRQANGLPPANSA